MNVDRRILAIRSAALRAIRNFFAERGFIEVETPVRIPTPALELHIEVESAGGWFLRTSPEFHMKRLLAAGLERIFQVGPCFRRGEQGRVHSPEFTMLEWYRVGADYIDVLADTKTLLMAVVKETLGGTRLHFDGHCVEVASVWECVSVSDAFILVAGWDPVRKADPDRFDIDLVEKVEPSLPRDKPVVLKDYPAYAAGFARLGAGGAIAERWELYVCGLELANACSELTGSVEYRRRMSEWSRRRQVSGRDAYPEDEGFIAALDAGLPECAGVALGVDRLIMLLADARDISQVRLEA